MSGDRTTMKKTSPNQTPAPSFRTGTAARLAGIPVATLRMWEHRYGVVGPQVSASGHRRYAAEDVSRLALIKALVDLGHPIGSLARLPLAALREIQAAPLAASAAARPPERKPSMLRVAIVGEALAARAELAAPRFPLLRVVATCADRERAAAALRGVTADLLAIELPGLREDAVEFVDALTAAVGARRAVVAYRFATEAAVRELRRRGHAVAHAPIDLAEIESAGAAAFAVREVAPAAAARRVATAALQRANPGATGAGIDHSALRVPAARRRTAAEPRRFRALQRGVREPQPRRCRIAPLPRPRGRQRAGAFRGSARPRRAGRRHCAARRRPSRQR